MIRPWLQLFTRDWLDSKELRRCDPITRSVLIDLMCLAHEGFPYGYLADKVGALTDEYMASRCVVPVVKFRRAVIDLVKNGRLNEKDGVYFIKRMVKDEDVRSRRAAGGKASIGRPGTIPPKVLEGYPSNHPSGDPCTHPLVENDPYARALADSDSSYESKKELPYAKTENHLTAEELEAAWARHKNYSRVYQEPQNLVFQKILSMNGAFDVAKFRVNHPRWCEYWEQHSKGWNGFGSVTFLGWIQAGMPEPPAIQKTREQLRQEQMMED